MYFTNKTKELIDKICNEHKLKAPITVYQAAAILIEYEGVNTTKDLFEGIVNEADNVFKRCAHEAALDTLIYPKCKNILYD